MGGGITAVPSAQQFGILGVTDEGYYVTAIPYSGSGESFRITLVYGCISLFKTNKVFI
jgi:hypothetical protein